MNTTQHLSLLAGLLTAAFATGCSTGQAVLTPVAENAAVPKSEESVDVLLDSAPTRPFRVVASLYATTLESTRSVKRMREEAARAGLDGIYWIECASAGSGVCTARGFVYTAWDSASVESGREVRTASR